MPSTVCVYVKSNKPLQAVSATSFRGNHPLYGTGAIRTGDAAWNKTDFIIIILITTMLDCE